MSHSFVTEAVTNAGWIQTFTGRKFYPLDPDTTDICIEDIAHALAMQSRFSGHGREFYSVAQHSLLVSRLCPRPLALWGLLHDAPEAYLVDLPSPVKHSGQFDAFIQADARLTAAVVERFALSPDSGVPPEVKHADSQALAMEARQLLGPLREGWGGPKFATLEYPNMILTPMSWQVAERAFLGAFKTLTTNTPHQV